MNLQSTKKLLNKLKTNDVDIDIDITKYNDIDNYHCNVLIFRGVDCLLITNDKTLFSFFIYDIDFKYFNEIVRESVFKILVSLDIPQYQFEKVLNTMENINFTKTSNKGVLSSMNSMKRHIEVDLFFSKHSLETINKRLNKIPHKRNEYEFSINLFRELLSDNGLNKVVTTEDGKDYHHFEKSENERRLNSQNYKSVNDIDWEG